MNILTTRFGLIQACETDVISIPEGLLGLPFVHSVRPPSRPGRERSVLVAERDRAGAGVRAGARPRWRSATTGSSFARATGRHSSWTTNGPR